MWTWYFVSFLFECIVHIESLATKGATVHMFVYVSDYIVKYAFIACTLTYLHSCIPWEFFILESCCLHFLFQYFSHWKAFGWLQIPFVVIRKLGNSKINSLIIISGLWKFAASDYYQFNDLLTPEEQAVRMRVRQSVEKEVAPIMAEVYLLLKSIFFRREPYVSVYLFYKC